jgi:type VI secretion system protein ImpB
MTSINSKLENTRKPRVHIKYEVETENGTIEKELPFVIGVMGDFSGNPTSPLKPVKERKFIRLNKDNFNEVMRGQNPGISTVVDNALKNDGSKMAIDLHFNKLQDFEPANIVEQVPALKKLRQARDQLRDLLSKSDRSDELESILEQALKNPGKLGDLADALGFNQKTEGV